MRFRDTLKFALELFVPEKLMHPGGGSASDPKAEASQNVATSLEAEETVQHRKARRIIEELDHAQFGGPSFGPQTIELMSTALEGAEASLPEPASDQQLRLIAAKILKVAGDGERDPIRLKAAAMSALGPVIGNADGQPPSA
ncbi:hypothetical protein V1294_002659 [Bradyrhizobium sp. AZCC 1678]